VRLFFLFVFIVIINSCNFNKSNFSRTKSGLEYRIVAIGNINEELPSLYDYIEFEYELTASNEKFETLKGSRVLQITETKEPIHEALKMLNRLDSAVFLIPSENLKAHFYLSPDVPEKLQLNLKVLNIYSPDDYQETFTNLRRWVNLPDEHEKQLLDSFLIKNNVKAQSFYNGIWCIETKNGKGEYLKRGKGISIHYIGKFLNGDIFDNTYRREPFSFIYGTEGQIIKGLEIGLEKLKKGSKAKIIIPSPLGFGNKGSSTGIIPPNTTLIYEVEVIRVNN
jgi:FKBP-type peptidyl-prolyl cis-trans isomerase FkpA